MSLTRLIVELFNAYSLIIVVYCIATWIPTGRSGVLADIKNVLSKICEPYLGLFRKLIPPIGGTVDVTPIVALLVLQLLENLLLMIF